MSLRDFNGPSRTLHTDPAGNSGGLGSFHTTNPEDRAPSNTPKIVGALVVALMVGVAGIGLYAYSGSLQPKPVVADNNLPQPPAPASAPIAPPPAQVTQQAANTPADTTPPASTATVHDSTPAPAPVKDASGKPVKAKRHVASNDSGSTSMPAANNSSSSSASSQTASNAASARMNADSSLTSQAPSQQAAVQAPQQTVTPSVTPQSSPSDVATNNTQSGQAVPQGATSASDMPAPNSAAQQQSAQQPVAPQPSAPAEQSGAAPAQ